MVPREGYCRMEVYEKTIWISRGILGFIALRELLLWMQRKESPMDHGQLSMVADKFQWVFSEALLNACGKETRFCRRERIITPFRLGWLWWPPRQATRSTPWPISTAAFVP